MNESKATRYQRLRRRAQLISAATGAALLLLVALTPGAQWLARVAANQALAWPASLQPAIALSLFVGALVLAAEAVAFPVSLYAATRGRRRSSQTRVDVRSVMASQARDAVVGAVVVIGVVAVLRVAMGAAGGWWWAVASALLAGASLVAMRLIGRGLTATGQTLALARPALSEALTALVARIGGGLVDVREWTSPDAGGARAVVTGVGGAGHVLLGRDMVRDWADDEVVVVVAHELSHHVHHDLARTVALDASLWCAALWCADRVVVLWGGRVGLQGVMDLAALPMLALAAGAVWGLVRPLRLAQSRAHERRADRFALEQTGNAEAFGRALRRLGEQHLAEERPSRWTRWLFHRHPPLDERLALGRDFSARRQ